VDRGAGGERRPAGRVGPDVLGAGFVSEQLPLCGNCLRSFARCAKLRAWIHGLGGWRIFSIRDSRRIRRSKSYAA
jgi:hypothetical protein